MMIQPISDLLPYEQPRLCQCGHSLRDHWQLCALQDCPKHSAKSPCLECPDLPGYEDFRCREFRP